MQQPMQHQLMGYDRTITMFSPDGRLLQVEYARKTVKQGNSAIGMVCKDGIIIVADKKIVDNLIITESIEKIFKIDTNIVATASGIISDARVLIERAQLKAQQNKITYDTDIDILTVVRDICNLKQVCTQSGGLRPFGVSLLIGSIDEDTPKLYETDPTGIYFRYKATSIGEHEEEIKDILQKEYKDSLSVTDGLKLAIKALIKTSEDDFNPERIDAAVIMTREKSLKKMERKEIEDLFQQVQKTK